MATPAQTMLAAVLAADARTVAELLNSEPHLADLADRSPRHLSVLHLAAGRGHLDIVELLLAAGATVDRYSHNGSTPLFEAAFGGHLDVARVLIAAGAETRATYNGGHSVLCAARQSGNQELLELLKSLPQPLAASIHARGYSRGSRRVT